MRSLVAIVGRPNVGKSTLFNRFIRQRLAIVEDTPGITRDRLYADAEWLGREFTLIDTGGIEVEGTDEIMTQIRKQAEIAMTEADAILFVVDARQGITPSDREIAEILRRAQKPVVLAVNKVDSREISQGVYEFYQLGLGDPIEVSAVNGLNTGDLLDAIVERLPAQEQDPYEDDTLRICFIGRPNVGKSSLVNAVLGEERVIVSDIPGTTRDAVDTPFARGDKKYVLVDTAGMRRKSKIYETVERYSVLRALRAVDRADVVMMVLDASQGVTEQDKRIAGYAHDRGRAMVLVVNKWDLIEKDNKTTDQFTKSIRADLAFVQYAPVVFVSAKTKQRIPRLIELVDYVAEQHAMRLATSTLNDLLQDAIQMSPPPSDKGRHLKILYISQVEIKPPTFVLFVNDPELMHFSYQRYLENKLRATYGFEGTPIRIHVRKR
ncbi:MAG: ribosome biogenesis GTPase Der [Bacillota bacterium]